MNSFLFCWIMRCWSSLTSFISIEERGLYPFGLGGAGDYRDDLTMLFVRLPVREVDDAEDEL